MIIYPYIVWSCIYELYKETFGHDVPYSLDTALYGFDYATLIAQTCVVLIQFLQFFWFLLLLRAIIKIITGTTGPKDTRSDSEASDTEVDKKHN